MQGRIFLPRVVAVLVAAPMVMAGNSEPQQLETLEIQASPFNTNSNLELTQPVDILSGDQLMLRSQSTLGETVSQELGITSSDFNPVGASRPIIRGLGGQRVKILENGSSAMDVSDISVDHAVTIQPVMARQIEILKGPSTLMYGSGAIGGVVNVVNDRIPVALPDELEGAFETRYNSATSERTAAFKINGAVGNFALHGDGMYLGTSDYQAANGTIPNSNVEIGQWSTGGTYFGDQGWVGVSISQLYDKYGIPVASGETEEPSIDLQQTRINLKSRVDDPFPGFRGLNFDYAWGDYKHIEFENPGDPGTEFNNREYELGLQLQHNSIASWIGAFGLQGGARDLNAIGDEAFIPPTKSWNIAGYLVEERDFGDWHVELGVRIEHNNYQPEQGQPSKSFTPYSLSGGAKWQFSEGYNLNFSLARAQRSPHVQELYANGPHVASQTFEIGSPNLQVETSNNIDLSINKTDAQWTWSLGVFFNYFENFIYLQEVDTNGDGLPDTVNEQGMLDPNGPFLLVFDQQQNANFYGVEAETSYRLITDNNGGLDFRLWGDWVRAEFADGNNVPRMAPWRVGGSVEYTLGSWLGGMDIFRAGEQNQTGNLETVTPGYTMLNVNVVYKLPTSKIDFSFFVRATNLLNEDARRSTSFLKDVAPLPGRSAMIGFRGEF